MVAANPCVSGDSVAIFGLVPPQVKLGLPLLHVFLSRGVESQHCYMGHNFMPARKQKMNVHKCWNRVGDNAVLLKFLSYYDKPA